MPTERSTLDRASATSPFYLGRPAHPSRGQNRYPAVADVTMNVKPRRGDDGTVGTVGHICGAHGGRARRYEVILSDSLLIPHRSSTVPLLCCRRWFEVKRARQVEGGGAEVEAVQGGPQVDHVPLLLAAHLETLEDVLRQMDAEGSAAAIGAVD